MDQSRRHVREELLYRVSRSPGDNVRDLVALAVPGREYLARRSISYADYLGGVVRGRGRARVSAARTSR